MVAVLIFLEGILAFISPCILPLLPVYLLYLAGDPGQGWKHQRVWNSIAFVCGFTLVFVSLGAAASALGHYLQMHIQALRTISAILVILLGLAFLFELEFLNPKGHGRKDAPAIRSGKWAGLIQSLLFGLVFAVTWTPCVGTFLATAMNLALNTETLLQGMALLLLFSLGLGLPFILLSLLYERLQNAIRFLKQHGRGIRLIGAILMILLGLAMLTGLFDRYLRVFGV